MADLDTLYQSLREKSVSILDYEGLAQDIAFNMMTVDSHIAGIADTQLSGGINDKLDLDVIRAPLLIDQRYWVNRSGEKADLSPYAELLDWAILLEAIRLKCLEASD